MVISKSQTPILLAMGLVLSMILVAGVCAAVPQERAASTVKVLSIAPPSSIAGTTVSTVVTGTGFTSGSQVRLTKVVNGRTVTIEATGESVSGGTTIKCRVPIPASAAPGRWDVRVRSGGREAVKSGSFTVIVNLPRVSAVSPSSGTRGSTVAIVVTGTGLVSGSNVRLTKVVNGRTVTIEAIGESVSGGTTIRCRVPIPTPAATGRWDVRVRSGDRDVVKSGAFTVTSQPSGGRIWFTHVPARTSAETCVTGKVSGVSPSQYRVTLYVRVRGNWWGPKPYWAWPTTTIAVDGTFKTRFVTGGVDEETTEFAAFLIPASYDPPDISWGSSLPSELFRYPNARATR